MGRLCEKGEVAKEREADWEDSEIIQTMERLGSDGDEAFDVNGK